MWTLALLTTAFFALEAGACPNQEEMTYYSELGCTPVEVGDDGCPKSYYCGERDKTKCYYKGKEYMRGQDLQEADMDDDCLAGCRCTGPDNPQFTCVGVECAEMVFLDPTPGCYNTYEHGHCCSVGRVCNQTSGNMAARLVCQYNSKEYQVGQMFYPEDEPCLRCICEAGFGPQVGPYCKKINCNLELLYGRNIADGCVPVYYGQNSCCPIGWRCPEKSDTVASATTVKNVSKNSNSDLQCEFGDVKMQVGDKLSPSGEWPNTECTCRVPPHPVCIQTRPSPVPYAVPSSSRRLLG